MGKQIYSDARELVRHMLRKARENAGLSQVDLAAKLGRTQSYVSDYERTARRLDWVAVSEVVEACGSDLVRFATDYVLAVKKIPQSKR